MGRFTTEHGAKLQQNRCRVAPNALKLIDDYWEWFAWPMSVKMVLVHVFGLTEHWVPQFKKNEIVVHHLPMVVFLFNDHIWGPATG